MTLSETSNSEFPPLYLVECCSLHDLRDWDGEDVNVQTLSIWTDVAQAIREARELTKKLSKDLELAYTVSEWTVNVRRRSVRLDDLWTSHHLIPGRPLYLQPVQGALDDA